MSLGKIREFLVPFVTFVLIIIVSAVVIAYGRGYRLDIIRKSLKPTGLIAATSDPTGAQVLIDGNLTTATNNSINVNPGWYTITIQKEGFQSWEKHIRVQGEVVTRADAYLFPANPSLSTLSTYGIVHPVLSPDGSKLAFIVPENTVATTASTLVNRSGIWILDLTERPLGFNRDARQIAKSAFTDFSDGVLTWSPDSKEILSAVENPVSGLTAYYLLDADRMNDSPQRVIDITDISTDWDNLQTLKNQEKLSGLKPELIRAVGSYMQILAFSPDETKILYQASVSATLPEIITPPLIGANSIPETRELASDSVYVYDIKEDKNYLIGPARELGVLPDPPVKSAKIQDPVPPYSVYSPPLPLQWLPTSRHLIILTKSGIDAMEYDATNRRTVYAGPFWDGFMAPWMNASRILILTTLNPAAGSVPNLYAVNFR